MKPTLALLLVVITLTTTEAQFGYARRGVIDLRQWDMASGGYVELHGEWELYMLQLVSASQLKNDPKIVRDYTDFPSTWNEAEAGTGSGTGYASYRVRVVLPETGSLAIELPHFYCSYRMWINGEPFASNGTVGTSVETSAPQWLPQTLPLIAKNDTLDVVVQVSNFQHAIGGVREAIRIGSAQALFEKREMSVMSTFVLCGGLVVIALTFVSIFFFRTESSAIYFAALCLTWAIRESFSNLYVFTAAYPAFPWDIAVRIEYIALYLTMTWAVLFLSKLFPDDVSVIFKYLFVSSNVLFIIFTLFASPASFTQFLPVYLSFAAILLLYVVYVLIHAVVKERQGVWLIVSCMMLGVIVFSYDLISYRGLTSYNAVITNAGYLIMFLLMAFCLMIQYGFIRRSAARRDMLTYEDLYGRGRK